MHCFLLWYDLFTCGDRAEELLRERQPTETCCCLTMRGDCLKALLRWSVITVVRNANDERFICTVSSFNNFVRFKCHFVICSLLSCFVAFISKCYIFKEVIFLNDASCNTPLYEPLATLHICDSFVPACTTGFFLFFFFGLMLLYWLQRHRVLLLVIC